MRTLSFITMFISLTKELKYILHIRLFESDLVRRNLFEFKRPHNSQLLMLQTFHFAPTHSYLPAFSPNPNLMVPRSCRVQKNVSYLVYRSTFSQIHMQSFIYCLQCRPDRASTHPQGQASYTKYKIFGPFTSLLSDWIMKILGNSPHVRLVEWLLGNCSCGSTISNSTSSSISRRLGFLRERGRFKVRHAFCLPVFRCKFINNGFECLLFINVSLINPLH